MKEKLVSIVTPCYNGADYLDDYFNSILTQDYSNCELIFIDDGSTDNSKNLVFKYKEKLENKGIQVRYFYQENQGVGFAISNGFKHIKGEYIIWPDCDDVLLPRSISMKVNFLENFPEYGAVRSDGIIVHEDNPDKVIRYFSRKKRDRFNENLFEAYLYGRNAWIMQGSFMIRTTSFLDVNPNRYIYKTRNGQAWQILLPVFHKYKCGYIDEPLYKYCLHKGSLSDQSNQSYEKKRMRVNNYEDIIINTINHMNIDDKEKEKYIDGITLYYINTRFVLAAEHRDLQDVKKYYRLLKEKNDINIKKYFIKLFSRSKSLNSLLFLIRKMKNSL